jgi:xanthine/uracil permease
MLVLLGYFVGVVLAFILLLIGNTLEVKYISIPHKAPFKCIFYSWIIVFLFSIYIIGLVYKQTKISDKIKKFLNNKPDLIKNK